MKGDGPLALLKRIMMQQTSFGWCTMPRALSQQRWQSGREVACDLSWKFWTALPFCEGCLEVACATRNGDPQFWSRNPSSWQAPETCLLGRKLDTVDWKEVLKIDLVYMIVFFCLHSIHLSYSSAESLIFIYMYYRVEVSPSTYFILHILKSDFETSHFVSCLCKNKSRFLYYPLWSLIDIRRVIFVTSLLFSINLTGDINVTMLNRQRVDSDLKNNNSDIITKNSYVFRAS